MMVKKRSYNIVYVDGVIRIVSEVKAIRVMFTLKTCNKFKWQDMMSKDYSIRIVAAVDASENKV